MNRGWIIVAAALWVITVTSGSYYSYGVFFKPMVAEFGWNRQLGAGVMGLACLIYVGVLPFVGHLADRRGPRLVMAASAVLLGLGYVLGAHVRSALQLYLFVGVLGGLSYPGLLPVPVAVVSRWFDTKRGLALGVALAGVGVGTLVVPPLAALLVSAYGWRVGFSVLGFVVLATCVPPCLLFMRDPQRTPAVSADGPVPAGPDQAGLSIGEALRTGVFWIVFAEYGLCIIVLGMIMIHIVPYLTDRGMSAPVAANVLGAIGLGSVIGRVLVGFVSDKYGIKRILAVCLAMMVIVLIGLAGTAGFLASYAYGFLYGVAYGGFMVAIPALTSVLFGLRAMGAIFSTISIAEGMGFAVGSYVAGYVWDVTGSYRLMFRIGVLLILATIGLNALIRVGSTRGSPLKQSRKTPG